VTLRETRKLQVNEEENNLQETALCKTVVKKLGKKPIKGETRRIRTEIMGRNI
jgi:hypothetical protein